MKTARKQDIVLAYVLATGGRLPESLDNLLEKIRALVPDLTESDLRKAIAWALRQLSLRSPHPPRHRRQLRDSRFFGCRRKKL
jgi:3-methyladenine DNA glycosylase AlkD